MPWKTTSRHRNPWVFKILIRHLRRFFGMPDALFGGAACCFLISTSLLSSCSFRSTVMSLFEYRSALAAMHILDASARAMAPRCHAGAVWTSMCWNRMPCFGGLLPFLRCLNMAFSAPRSCTVLDGIDASLLRLPACMINLAPTTGPAMADMLGATWAILDSTYF